MYRWKLDHFGVEHNQAGSSGLPGLLKQSMGWRAISASTLRRKKNDMIGEACALLRVDNENRCSMCWRPLESCPDFMIIGARSSQTRCKILGCTVGTVHDPAFIVRIKSHQIGCLCGWLHTRHRVLHDMCARRTKLVDIRRLVQNRCAYRFRSRSNQKTFQGFASREVLATFAAAIDSTARPPRFGRMFLGAGHRRSGSMWLHDAASSRW